MKPIQPPPLDRPAVHPVREALPKGAMGALPEHDGDPFQVNLPGGEPLMSAALARRTVEQVVRAFGWNGSPQDLKIVRDEAGVQHLISFEQRFRNVRVEYADVRAVFQRGRGLVAVTGRIFSKIQPSNRLILTEAQAVVAARAHVAKETKLVQRQTAKAEQVLLPYGAALKYAWRVEVPAAEGDYRLWIDAETKRVLQLEPLFSSGG